METKTLQEFKTDNNFEIIKNLIKENGGYITSRIVTELGIHRMYLNLMLENGQIERVTRGIYISKETMEDAYYTFQLRYPKTIFSIFTALYFHNLTEIFPYNFDLTVDRNYHSAKIEKKHNVTKCDKKILNIGLTELETPMGNKVKAYDKERCICDIIKYQQKLDSEQVKKSVKMYVKDKNKNLKNLTKYAKEMGINKKVLDYIGMFYE